MFAVQAAGERYVDRGDPSGYDFTLTNFTTSGTWHELDLSTIVPNNAKSVLLHSVQRASGTGGLLRFRKKGNSNAYNVSSVRNPANLQIFDGLFIVSLVGDAIVEYYAANVTWNRIDLVVRGWWV